MAINKDSYAQAMARLETIVRQIDSNELDIDELAGKLKEANEIIEYCTAKLNKVDQEVEKMLDGKADTEE